MSNKILKKFRAWDRWRGKMGIVINIERVCEEISIGDIRCYNKYVGFHQDTFEEFVPDEEEVMQFAGLKDKNGKEIYEGDIIKTFISKESVDLELIKPEILIVRFKNGAFITEKDWGDGDFNLSGGLELNGYWLNEIFEIFSNIYESPELLKS